MSAAIDVLLRSEWILNGGYRYDVLLGDAVIVSGSRDPEHDAARALLARGHRGRFRTIDFATRRHRMAFDVEMAARLRTVERDKGGIAIVRYRPLSKEIAAVLSPHTPRQGRPFGVDGSQGAGEPAEAAGGKTWEAPTPVLSLPDGDLPPLTIPEEA